MSKILLLLIEKKRITQWMLITSFTLVSTLCDLTAEEIIALAGVLGGTTLGIGSVEKKGD